MHKVVCLWVPESHYSLNKTSLLTKISRVPTYVLEQLPHGATVYYSTVKEYKNSNQIFYRTLRMKYGAIVERTLDKSSGKEAEKTTMWSSVLLHSCASKASLQQVNYKRLFCSSYVFYWAFVVQFWSMYCQCSACLWLRLCNKNTLRAHFSFCVSQLPPTQFMLYTLLTCRYFRLQVCVYTKSATYHTRLSYTINYFSPAVFKNFNRTITFFDEFLLQHTFGNLDIYCPVH